MTNDALKTLVLIEAKSEVMSDGLVETPQHEVDPMYENGWGNESDAVRELVEEGLLCVNRYEPGGQTLTYSLEPEALLVLDSMGVSLSDVSLKEFKARFRKNEWFADDLRYLSVMNALDHNGEALFNLTGIRGDLSHRRRMAGMSLGKRDLIMR